MKILSITYLATLALLFANTKAASEGTAFTSSYQDCLNLFRSFDYTMNTDPSLTDFE